MAKNPRITRRVVNSKRHTVGFVLTGGRQVTRAQAIQMASSNGIAGVRVVNGPQGRYLQSTGERGLYELPIARQPGARAARSSTRSTRSARPATAKAARRRTTTPAANRSNPSSN